MTHSDLSIQSATNGTQLWDMNAPTTPHGKAFARAFDLGRAMVQDLDGRICFWSTVHELPDHVVVLDAACRHLLRAERILTASGLRICRLIHGVTVCFTGASKIAADVTERKRAEAHARKHSRN